MKQVLLNTNELPSLSGRRLVPGSGQIVLRHNLKKNLFSKKVKRNLSL